MSLAAGSRLETYDIVGLIGAGGMGEVYRARDSKLKRDVAIKILPAFFTRDPDRLHRFELEAQAAAALNHPNILSIFHIGQHDGAPYIVTELLQGETLRQRLRQSAIPLREVLEIGNGIAEGLAAAHSAGIVHRDIKPDNVFITKEGRVKILDFGLARFTTAHAASADGPTMTLQPATDPGQVLGTVGYMAPEQVRGTPADSRSDIFALRVVLYEMVTGQPAFRKETGAETMSAILKEDPPPISQLSSTAPLPLQRVIDRCLKKNPEQRFQHASDLAFALEAVSASGTNVFPALAAGKPSRKNWILIAAAALAVVAIAAAVFWWRQPPSLPTVQSITQLTDTPEAKIFWPLLTDGSRIYYNEGSEATLHIGEVAVTGGRSSNLSTPFASPYVLGVAPKGSALLVRSDGIQTPEGPLWIVSLPSGEVRRLTGIEAGGGSITPDGHILYEKKDTLFIANSDGSSARKLVTSNGNIGEPSMSPDRKHIAFTTYKNSAPPSTIYVADADGGNVRALLSSDTMGGVCCVGWSADSKYLIVPRLNGIRRDLWIVSVEKDLLGRTPAAMQLTNGPLTYDNPTSGPDRDQIFAIGIRDRGELVHYDIAAHTFLPLLGGISAGNATFSKDGAWVAYITYPEGTLWRSRADGSERLQLTFPPVFVGFPTISPDGKRVAYNSNVEPGQVGLWVIGMDGGTPQKVSVRAGAGDWSPDGNRLVYAEYSDPNSPFHKARIKVLDFASGNTTEINSPIERDGVLWLGPDKILASRVDSRALDVLDLNTQKWSSPISNPKLGATAHWARSSDYKYLYYTTAGRDAKAVRVRTSDFHAEVIADVKDFHFATTVFGVAMSVAPDGSPVFTRDTGDQQVYALTIDWPH